MKNSLAIVVLTCNEADNLGRCLAAVPEHYKRIVVDSGSDDSTVELARKLGCNVFFNTWNGFAAQRNFALEHCTTDHEWVLFVDVDEIYPSTFYEWCEQVVLPDPLVGAVMVPSFLYIRDKRLNYAPGYPIYHPRLVRRGKVHFVTNHTGHGESVSTNGDVITATIAYDHYFFDGDLAEWMRKHVGNAEKETELKPTKGAVMTHRGRLSLMLGRSILRIPARFFYHYVLRRGFLDGAAGFQYSVMYSWFEFTKYALRIRK